LLGVSEATTAQPYTSVEMHPIIPQLGRALRPAFQGLVPIGAGRRLSTFDVCGALASVRPLLEQEFGGPLYHRFEGCVDQGDPPSLRLDGTQFRVLEYLWDFSISRFSIPQAIEDPRAPPLNGGRFDVLFAAESELGTANEVCRDLLKLMVGRATIRCLVYRLPEHQNKRNALDTRLMRVLQNYAHFANDPGLWLFVSLRWGTQQTQCTITTLNDNSDGLVAVPI
jgi:hypothetical protein